MHSDSGDSAVSRDPRDANGAFGLPSDRRPISPWSGLLNHYPKRRFSSGHAPLRLPLHTPRITPSEPGSGTCTSFRQNDLPSETPLRTADGGDSPRTTGLCPYSTAKGRRSLGPWIASSIGNSSAAPARELQGVTGRALQTLSEESDSCNQSSSQSARPYGASRFC